MNWECKKCGKKLTTNTISGTPSKTGCKSSKDGNHAWVKKSKY